MMAKLGQREKKRKRQKVAIERGGEGEEGIMFTEMPPNSAELPTTTTMPVAHSTTMQIMPIPHILVPLGEVSTQYFTINHNFFFLIRFAIRTKIAVECRRHIVPFQPDGAPAFLAMPNCIHQFVCPKKEFDSRAKNALR